MSDAPTPQVQKGMKGLVVAESTLSLVNGEEGKLIYRGYSIEDLADHCSYEEVVHLLLMGTLPTKAQLNDLNLKIHSEMGLSPLVKSVIDCFPLNAEPMAVMRTAVSTMSETDPDRDDDSEAAIIRKAIRVIAKLPMIVAHYNRRRNGQEPLDHKPEYSLAANFLYCMTGDDPIPAAIKALDLYLVLLADHGLNASTFASLVTAGTKGDYHSCIVSAIGTLKGPLHGGANRAAMEMLEKLTDADQARQWVLDALARKERIMGFGHRVYRTKDPRGTCLYKAAVKLLQDAGKKDFLEICHAVERTVKEEKGLDYNVDFYSAPVLNVLGIPTDTFVDIFAMSRSVGWSASIIEFKRDPALIRPKFAYVGDFDQTVTPIANRG
jgi:citrate synthase